MPSRAPRSRNAGLLANEYVRRTVDLEGPIDTRGGVKGSFPIDGDYGSYEYPNWAAKFMIDSLQLECEICSSTEQLAAATV